MVILIYFFFVTDAVKYSLYYLHFRDTDVIDQSIFYCKYTNILIKLTLFLQKRHRSTNKIANNTELRTSKNINKPSFVLHSILLYNNHKYLKIFLKLLVQSSSLLSQETIIAEKLNVLSQSFVEKSSFYWNLSQVFPNCTSNSQSISFFLFF